jgi:hypothetical protein
MSLTSDTSSTKPSGPPPPPPGGPPAPKVVQAKPKLTEAEQSATENRLLAAGRAELVGSWADHLHRINAWWVGLKTTEKVEDWDYLYMSDRICVRGINTSSGALGGWLMADAASGAKDAKQERVLLWRDPESIRARMVPDNFLHAPGEKSAKNKLGLHALSTCLLDHHKAISDQVKPYEKCIQVFMPVPSERDLQIFAALSSLRGADEKRLIEMRASMTRVEGAAGEDMHTRYVYERSAGGGVSVRYGVTGTYKDNGAVKLVSPIDIRARRTNALEYHRVLGEGATAAVGEVVVSFRQCANPFFPLFTEWDETDKRYYIGKPVPTSQYAEWWSKEILKTDVTFSKMDGVDKTHTLERTGGYITDQGELVPPK